MAQKSGTMLWWLLGVATVLTACFLLFFWRSATFDENSRPFFDHGQVAFVAANGERIPFQVEIARTPEQQAYGLMFQRELPQGRGMLFIFDPPQQVAFWMKNTFIPLDIIYVRPDGKIAQIFSQAKPLDKTPLRSQDDISYVVEVGGGEAQRLHLRDGDALTIGE